MIPEVGSTRRSLPGRIVVFAGLLTICAATLSPIPAQESVAGLCLICGEVGGVDALLNFLLFIPFGIGWGILRVSWWKAITTCLLLTLLIESLQLTTILGRDASVGDVVTNTIGGSAGIALGRHTKNLVRPSGRTRRLLVAGAFSLWVVACVITAYSLQPRPSDPPFYGQLARQRSADPPYPGTVDRALLGGTVIPDEEIAESQGIASALRAGQPFSVHVVPRAVPAWFSPIGRIADRRDAEIALIAAHGPDVVFRVRTNASLLRLRPYTLGVHSALQLTGRPVDIVGTFHRGEGHLVISSEGGTRRAAVVFGLGSGWRMILPFNSVASGSAAQSALDVVWLSFLVLPIAYWCTIGAHQWRLAAFALGLTALLVVSTRALATTFDLTPSGIDIVGVMAGVTIGSALSRLIRAPSVINS